MAAARISAQKQQGKFEILLSTLADSGKLILTRQSFKISTKRTKTRCSSWRRKSVTSNKKPKSTSTHRSLASYTQEKNKS